MKPMLASDFVQEKIRWPAIAQPKIDGVRGLNLQGALTGRSLKAFGNKFTNNFFGSDVYRGFDGEMAAESEVHPDLCRLTTSALNTHEGEPYVLWWLFDYVTPETLSLPYHKRYTKLLEYVQNLDALEKRVRVVPSHFCTTLDQLLELEERWLGQGYEGAIIRDPQLLYKHGRSTVREGGMLRIKRFIDAEIVVTGIVEGQQNNNEAQVNELGLQYRSTHAAGMVQSGKVGTILGEVLARVVDPITGAVLLEKGQMIEVSPGRMTASEREFYFQHPDQIIGQIAKFQFFPKGLKDKPRFPTFQSFRMKADM